MEQVDRQAYVFTLVHGTFAADAPWVHATGADSFRDRLRTALAPAKVRFRHIEWGKTGRVHRYIYDQRDTARLKGAEALQRELREAQQDADGARHFVVAHSHGGNVALYALADESLQESVDGVVCMATPFLYPRLRPIGLARVWLAPLAAGCFFYLVPGYRRWCVDAFGGWLLFLSIALLAICVIVSATITAARLLANRDGNGLTKYYDSVRYDNVSTPLLLLRSSGDEASGLLRLGQLMNFLFGTGLSRVLYRLVWLVGFVCLILVFKNWALYREIQMAGVTEGVDGWIDRLFTFVLAPVIHALLILAGMFTLGTAASRIVVGSDAIKWFGELETMTEESPPGLPASITTFAPLDPSQAEGKAFLAHSRVYDRAETAPTIADWCRKNAGS